MSPIRSTASKRYIYIAAVILLLSKVIPSYSYYANKGLIYITIMALSGRQPSFYIKCTKSNMPLSCNV